MNGHPKNRETVVRLVEFLKEILDICNALAVAPILDGSLAVFAYTGDQSMVVNDADLSCPESEFPRIIDALEERGITYRLREWHVLQILRDDLKVEVGSVEYWYKDLPTDDCETLAIDDYRVRVLSLSSLTEFYRRGMEDRAKKTEENEKIKYNALKAKYDALVKLPRSANVQKS